MGFRTAFLSLILLAEVILAQDTLEIPYLEKARIKLDGKLVDSVYNEARKIRLLTQIAPVYNEPFPESTIVYTFQTDNGIYFGFHCETKNRSPDRTPFGDFVYVYLDTYLDRKSAYLFRVMAEGTKIDARVTDDGEKHDFDFETLWEGKVYCAENYFEVEIFVPWKGVMGKEGSWGIDIGRNLPDGTRGVLTAYNPHEERFRISRFAIIKQVNFMGKELVTEIQPILVINHGKDFAESVSYSPNLSGNVYLRMRENFKLAITYNPDFAEIEADPFQLNFSKYALFYEETRPFFCEGQEFFSFSGFRPLNIFYSRQIGKTLPSGKIIPILIGGKGFLKTDIMELSALYSKTEETYDIFGVEPATSFLVNKLKLLPTESFSVSLLSAYRFPYKENPKGLFGTQIFYQDPLTTLSIEQVFDNYTSKDYATEIKFSKQIKEIKISQTITSIPDKFSDQEVGYIPWQGLNKIDTDISYNYFMNKHRIYFINPRCGFSYEREIDEPYVWDINIGSYIYFQNRWAFISNLSYGKDFERGNLFTAPSYHIGIFTDPSLVVSMELFSYGFKTYNYRQNYVGWVVTNRLKPMIKFGSLFSFIELTQWNEFDPNNKLVSTTYSLSPDIHLTLFKRCGLSFYAHLPFKENKLLSGRGGCYLSWNPSEKTWLKSTYNDYRVHHDTWTSYINKGVLKLKTSFYF